MAVSGSCYQTSFTSLEILVLTLQLLYTFLTFWKHQKLHTLALDRQACGLNQSKILTVVFSFLGLSKYIKSLNTTKWIKKWQ